LCVIFSLCIGALLSSRVYASSVGNAVISLLQSNESIGSLLGSIGRLDAVVSAIVAMIVSPIIFLIVFLILRLICHIVMSIVYKKALQGVDKTEYRVGENDGWYKRNDKKIGAVVGGITGFLTVLILFSPIIGTLKAVDSVTTMIYGDRRGAVREQENDDQADARSADYSEEGSSKSAIDIVSDYANDFAGTVMYYCGGKAIYDMSARAEIDGHTVILTQEIESVSNIMQDLSEVAPALTDIGSFSTEHVEKLENICVALDDSYFLSLLSSSVVSSASQSWVMREDFIGIPRPDFNYSISSFCDSILSVLATTTPDTVSSDLSTFMRVCDIIMNSGLLQTDGDYMAIMAMMEDGSFLNDLIGELEKNPRTAHLVDSLHLFAMNSLVNTLKFDGYDVAEYYGLMEDIAEQFNRMNGQTHEKKVEDLANYTVEYLQDYGVDIPTEVAKVVADAMLTDIPNSDGYITAEQMQEFFDKYYQGN